MDSGFPPSLTRQVAAVGRIPLAVAVVDGDGRISHWSSGAQSLFGHSAGEATGCHAADLMPVAGGLADDETGLAHGREDHAGALPRAGRATAAASDGGRTDILWWVYPLREDDRSGPGHTGRAGHLVLAADGRRLVRDSAFLPLPSARIMPGFARAARFPGAVRLAALFPSLLPETAADDAGGITQRVLELGCPVLEFNRCGQRPVTRAAFVPEQVKVTACGSRAGSP